MTIFSRAFYHVLRGHDFLRLTAEGRGASWEAVRQSFHAGGGVYIQNHHWGHRGHRLNSISALGHILTGMKFVTLLETSGSASIEHLFDQQHMTDRHLCCVVHVRIYFKGQVVEGPVLFTREGPLPLPFLSDSLVRRFVLGGEKL